MLPSPGMGFLAHFPAIGMAARVGRPKALPRMRHASPRDTASPGCRPSRGPCKAVDPFPANPPSWPEGPGCRSAGRRGCAAGHGGAWHRGGPGPHMDPLGSRAGSPQAPTFPGQGRSGLQSQSLFSWSTQSSTLRLAWSIFLLLKLMYTSVTRAPVSPECPSAREITSSGMSSSEAMDAQECRAQ